MRLKFTPKALRIDHIITFPTCLEEGVWRVVVEIPSSNLEGDLLIPKCKAFQPKGIQLLCLGSRI